MNINAYKWWFNDWLNGWKYDEMRKKDSKKIKQNKTKKKKYKKKEIKVLVSKKIKIWWRMWYKNFFYEKKPKKEAM